MRIWNARFVDLDIPNTRISLGLEWEKGRGGLDVLPV
jgi:hypothetical protein